VLIKLIIFFNLAILLLFEVFGPLKLIIPAVFARSEFLLLVKVGSKSNPEVLPLVSTHGDELEAHDVYKARTKLVITGINFMITGDFCCGCCLHFLCGSTKKVIVVGVLSLLTLLFILPLFQIP